MSIQKKRKRYRLRKRVKQTLGIFFGFGAVCTIFAMMFLYLSEPKYATEGIELNQVGSIEVLTQYIPEGRQNRPGILREIRWIVIHETDNFAKSADAQHHSDYLATNDTDVNSWHYTVDETIIIHQLPDEEVGWHAGDQMSEHGGNMSGIGIEMCVNEGSDFDRTVDNTAHLAAVLLESYHLKIDSLKRHHDFSGKNCPAHFYKEEDWQQFVELVKSYMK
ncbi:MAG: N-acetylmuramoyl-L-alanine amidase [Erysipelotrichaceae bacterium]|nr:N-acetylmuramoyl-L-alanine amidase [Erysipelotrichaceae bacterium]